MDSSLNIDLSGERISYNNRLDLEAFNIRGNTGPDNFDIRLNWENNRNLKSSGSMIAQGVLSVPDSLNPRLKVDIVPSSIFLRGEEWNIDHSTFSLDSTSFVVNNFVVSKGADFFKIDGKVSEDRSDTLTFGFNNLDLAGLNHIKRKERPNRNPDAAEFILGGTLNGDILLTDLYNNLLFESDIIINDFITNEHSHGDVSIISDWNNDDNLAGISLSNNIDGQKTFDINGDYNPSNRSIDLITELNEIPLDALNLVLYTFASGVRGYGSGKARVSGSVGNPQIYGSVMAADASMIVDYLQSEFLFSDSIRFDRSSITENSIRS